MAREGYRGGGSKARAWGGSWAHPGYRGGDGEARGGLERRRASTESGGWRRRRCGNWRTPEASRLPLRLEEKEGGTAVLQAVSAERGRQQGAGGERFPPARVSGLQRIRERKRQRE